MQLVPDEIVAEILFKEIENIDKNKSLIIQGFPWTWLQALMLIDKGVIPDGILYLKQREKKVKEALRKKL